MKVHDKAIKNTLTADEEQQEILNIKVQIKGRHDPIIVPRAVVVVEAMVALTVLDMMFVSMTSKLDDVKKFFGNTDS